MITLAEIKAFLGITNTSKDSFLLNSIPIAVDRLNSLCNRNLNYQLITEYKNFNVLNVVRLTGYTKYNEYYFKESPVESLLSIKKYNSDTNEYENLITGDGDTIVNSTQIINGSKTQTASKLILNKGYHLSGLIEVKYYSGFKATKVNKTISAISQSSTLAVITIGTHSYLAGEVFSMQGITGFLNNPNGTFVIDSVTATQIKITFDLGTGSYVSGGVAEFDAFESNTTPEDLKQALLYLVAEHYYNSPISDKARLGVSSHNIGTQASEGTTYKKIDIKELIIDYRELSI